jgi:hypothetical protein
MVEPCLLFLESPLSLVEVVEASILPFAVTPGLRGFVASGCVRRSGLTFRRALVRVGGVDRVGLLLKDEALTSQIVGHRHLLLERCALGLITACLGCFGGDQASVSRGDGRSCPAAGETHLPLRVHRVVAELELIPGHHLLLPQTEHKNGGGEHHEVEDLLRWVRP